MMNWNLFQFLQNLFGLFLLILHHKRNIPEWQKVRGLFDVDLWLPQSCVLHNKREIYSVPNKSPLFSLQTDTSISNKNVMHPSECNLSNGNLKRCPCALAGTWISRHEGRIIVHVSCLCFCLCVGEGGIH